MHILGMNGMPRRIPDYPDMYIKLNAICSLGSMITTVSLIVFILLIYKLLLFEPALIFPSCRTKGQDIKQLMSYSRGPPQRAKRRPGGGLCRVAAMGYVSGAGRVKWSKV